MVKLFGKPSVSSHIATKGDEVTKKSLKATCEKMKKVHLEDGVASWGNKAVEEEALEEETPKGVKRKKTEEDAEADAVTDPEKTERRPDAKEKTKKKKKDKKETKTRDDDDEEDNKEEPGSTQDEVGKSK